MHAFSLPASWPQVDKKMVNDCQINSFVVPTQNLHPLVCWDSDYLLYIFYSMSIEIATYHSSLTEEVERMTTDDKQA